MPTLVEDHPVYESISLDELDLLPDPEWLVDHWCMRQSVTLLTGNSESFKTFIAMDLAAKVSNTGFSHFGPHHIDRTTVHGGPMKVLYVIGESMGAAKFRFQAIRQYHKLDNLPALRVHPNRVDLFTEPDSVEEFVEREDPDIVIFDTWSRNTYGMDENDKSEVDKVLRVAHALKQGGSRGGRSIIIIHHPNKAGSYFRGHTALLNDTDIMIGTERFDEKKDNPVAPFYTQVKSLRQKETDDFRPYWAKLVTQTILDSTGTPRLKLSGEPLNSLVIESVDEQPEGMGVKEELGLVRVAPVTERVMKYIEATPGATAAEIQEAVWEKPGKHVFSAISRLGELVYEEDGKYYINTPAPLDELTEI